MSSFGGSELLAQYHIELGAQADDLFKTLNDVRAEVDRTVASVQSKAKSGGITGIFGEIGRFVREHVGTLATAAGATVAAVASMTAAAEAQEKANRRLSRSLDPLVADVRAASAEFDQFAEHLASITGRSENVIKKLGAIGATIGGLSGEQLEQAVAAAEGLSAKYEHLGLSVEDAMNMIARAAKGDFSGFDHLGIDLRNVADGTEAYARIMGIAVTGMRDAAIEADTSGKALGHLWNEVQHLTAALGDALGLGDAAGESMNVIAQQVHNLTKYVKGLADEVDSVRKSLKDSLGVGSFSELFNFDVLILEFKRLFSYIEGEIQILANHLYDAFAGAINALARGLPPTLQEMLGIDPKAKARAALQDQIEQKNAQWEAMRAIAADRKLPLSAADESQLRKLLEKGQTEIARLTNERANLGLDWGAFATAMIGNPNWKKWNPQHDEIDRMFREADRIHAEKARVTEAVKNASDLLALNERSKTATEEFHRLGDELRDLRGRLAKMGQPADVLARMSPNDLASENQKVRDSMAAADEELKRMIAALRAQHPEKAKYVQDFIDKYLGVPTGNLGIDPFGKFKPQSVQTAIGELQIPGTQNRQITLLEDVSKNTKKTNEILDKHPVSTIAIV